MRAWLEVDLEAVAHNYRCVQDHVGPDVRVCGVVKADAYGHGIEAIAGTLSRCGIDSFAVISLDEAIRVRAVSPLPVLIMGYLDDEDIETAIREGFTISLYDRELAPLYCELAAKVGRPVRVQVKVETGLNRLGMEVAEALEIFANPGAFPGLEVEAVYTHLSSSGDIAEDERQMARFQPLLDAMDAMGVNRPAHMANSHALPVFPAGRLSCVRIGLALYGVEPVLPNLKASLQAKTVVIQKKKLRAGEGTSYNKLFRAEQDMEIAIIAMGYAEGLSQALTGKASVIVGGVKTPILGQICMNLCVIDATGLPVKRGDEVVVIGTQGNERICVVDMAKACGLRHHEIITRMGKSLPKVYIGVEDRAFPGLSCQKA